MKFDLKKVSIIVIIIFILVAIVLLPLFSFDGYSIIKNTTSHLGSQGAPYNYIMNITFVLLGITSVIIAINTKIISFSVIGSLFGLSLILTAFFKHESFIISYESNLFEDQMHSVFATMTGFSFVLLSMMHAIISKDKQRVYAIIVSIFATLNSLVMFLIPDIMGLLQRLMFMVSFTWLFFIMKPPLDKINK